MNENIFKKRTVNLAACGLMLGFACFLLSDYIGVDRVMMTTDAAITEDAYEVADGLELMQGIWRTGPLMGSGHMGRISVMYLLMLLLPAILWNNLNYCIGMLLTSFALYAYLVRKRLEPISCLLGVLAACWLGTNITLIYAGHVSKPFVIFFFALSLVLASINTLSGSLLWGASIGLMFVQQPDVGLFFAMFAGPYKLFKLWESKERKVLFWVKNLLPALVLALLFAAGTLLGGYKKHVKDTSQFDSGASKQKWEYVTQWSWPPEESIAFVAPGYTGWRSGDPEGPYWGRMGRSAGWEQTRQGFMNYKMEATYLGFIPVAFALFALFSCRRLKQRNEIIFWGISAILALLLSFGKYFPLYKLIYALPLINNIRNPNKFMQVFQVCIAILSAYGFHALFSAWAEDTDKQKTVRRFFWLLSGAVILLFLWSAVLTVTRGLDVASVCKIGWPQATAEIIVSNKIRALWHASVMGMVLALCFGAKGFGLDKKKRGLKLCLAIVMLAMVAMDAVNVTKRYIKEMPRGYIEENSLTKFLKRNIGNERVAIASQQGIYNLWVTYLLPYHKIASFNFSAMPRMPKDYENFLKKGSTNPLRMWQLSGVKYLLAPSAIEKQIPAGEVTKVFAYNVVARGSKGNFAVSENPNGQHAVFALNKYVPRIAIFADWKQRPVETELNALFSPALNIFTILTVQSDIAAIPGGETATADYNIVESDNNRIVVRTKASDNSILRVGNHYDRDWHAMVDGKSAPVLRVDYLCQGVFLSPGEHEVILKYQPTRIYLYLFMLGTIIATGALGVVLFKRKITPHGR